MSRNEVAVLIRDPKELFLALELLKKLDVSFCVCAPQDPSCITAKVLLSTEHEPLSIVDDRLVLLDRSVDRSSIQILLKLLDISNPQSWAIGVDPGMRFGVALVADGQTLLSRTLSSPSESVQLTIQWAAHVHSLFPDSQLVVHLGVGSRLYMVLYARILLEVQPNVRIELVNEHHTTLSSGHLSNESSAGMIAVRRGRPIVESDLTLEVREGYVNSVKRLYSRLSRGKKSLSSEEARALIRGEVTMADLLSLAE
ncbi:MAG: hypothetical protein HXY34_08350 [Candidatus Thorarchaeota archaeon]|nr:hypothetical protein [Candidatus Thorarchaeota archaeon]